MNSQIYSIPINLKSTIFLSSIQYIWNIWSKIEKALALISVPSSFRSGTLLAAY